MRVPFANGKRDFFIPDTLKNDQTILQSRTFSKNTSGKRRQSFIVSLHNPLFLHESKKASRYEKPLFALFTYLMFIICTCFFLNHRCRS